MKRLSRIKRRDRQKSADTAVNGGESYQSDHQCYKRVVLRHLCSLLVLLMLPTTAFAQRVTRVIDGDTIVVETVGTVRLIGVDTPETKDPRKPVQAFGAEAAAFLRQLVTDQVVRLDYEGVRLDRYGRTLAYVYLRDGRFVNAEIVRQGFGHAYLEFPFEKAEAFRLLEREARAAHRGLWALAPDVAAATTVFVNVNSDVYHTRSCRYVTADSHTMTVENAQQAHRACAVCRPVGYTRK